MILECSSAIWDFSGLHHHVVCSPYLSSIFSTLLVLLHEDTQVLPLLYRMQREGGMELQRV